MTDIQKKQPKTADVDSVLPLCSNGEAVAGDTFKINKRLILVAIICSYHLQPLYNAP